ncbi:hypothetical protein NFI96_011594 [Prochilodus magdalenae]|nr:hypothetical protein NFI96_011594 [Prochilodus magdalenae]
MSSDRQSVHSFRCSSAAEFFLPQTQRCERCTAYFRIVPGKEFAPNCGLSDDGGRNEAVYKDCPTGTFNNGTSVWCQKCSTCPSSHSVPCTVTSDTYCCKEGQNDELGKCRDVAKTSTVKRTALTTTPTMTIPEYPAMPSPVMTTIPKPPVTTNPKPPVTTNPKPPVTTNPKPPVTTNPKPPVTTNPKPPETTNYKSPVTPNHKLLETTNHKVPVTSNHKLPETTNDNVSVTPNHF